VIAEDVERHGETRTVLSAGRLLVWLLLASACRVGPPTDRGPLLLLTPFAVVVGWETGTAQPSSLDIRAAEGAWRTVGQDHPTREHVVLVGGLTPRTRYSLRIRGAADAAPTFVTPAALSEEELHERVLGGWLGKVIGNELGLPFEEAGLFEHCRAPFSEDISRYDGESDGVRGRVPVNHYVNDDTGLLFLSLLTVEAHGRDFTSRQLAEQWLLHMVGHDQHLWCAEPFAIRSFEGGVWPPESGRNPYSHHLDAQMRADIWGWLAPGRPGSAAEMARRDASLSNDGEGVDGAAFVAALVSGAFYTTKPRNLVRAACSVLPPESLHRRIALDVLRWSAASPQDWRTVWHEVEKKYARGRYQPHDGHAESMILAGPNAANILLGVLHGGGDFSRSISIAVSASWDTDCNGGNVGAIVGAMVGEEAIPARWIEPLHDEFSIRDFYGGLPDVLSIREVGERIDRARAR